MRGRTFTELIEDILADICDNYCKYPEQYADDDGVDALINERCDNCPFQRLYVPKYEQEENK